MIPQVVHGPVCGILWHMTSPGLGTATARGTGIQTDRAAIGFLLALVGERPPLHSLGCWLAFLEWLVVYCIAVLAIYLHRLCSVHVCDLNWATGTGALGLGKPGGRQACQMPELELQGPVRGGGGAGPMGVLVPAGAGGRFWDSEFGVLPLGSTRCMPWA